MPAQTRLGQGAADLIRRKEIKRAPAAAPAPPPVTQQRDAPEPSENAEEVHRVPVDRITRHPLNPRGEVPADTADLADLTRSITELGVLEPLVASRRDVFLHARPALVDQIPADTDWVLVAGERRLQAARAAGLATVPVISGDHLVIDGVDLEAMIVENIQRESLEPLAEARAYQALTDTGLSQRVIAKRVGRGQAHISRRLSLLKLPDKALAALADGTLGIKDAETLGGVKDLADITQVWQIAWERRQWGNGLDIPGAIRVHDGTKQQEAKRLAAQETARKKAHAEGLPVVDDMDVPIWDARIDAADTERLEVARTNGTLAVTVDENTGRTAYIDTSITADTLPKKRAAVDHHAQQKEQEQQRRAAAKGRRQVLPVLLAQKRSAGQVADELAELVLRMANVDELRLAAKLAPDIGHGWSDSAESLGGPHYAWKAAALDGSPAHRQTAARAIMLARAEKRLDNPWNRWDAEDLRFLDRLISETGYTEGPYEHRQRIAATHDDDDEPDDLDESESEPDVQDSNEENAS